MKGIMPLPSLLPAAPQNSLQTEGHLDKTSGFPCNLDSIPNMGVLLVEKEGSYNLFPLLLNLQIPSAAATCRAVRES